MKKLGELLVQEDSFEEIFNGQPGPCQGNGGVQNPGGDILSRITYS